MMLSSYAILLVEDTNTGLDRFKTLTSGLPIEIYIAKDKNNINAALEHVKSEGLSLLAAVVNLSLHKGPQDGINMIAHLREKGPVNLPVIVWTKHGEDWQQKALDAGADVAFSKYIQDGELREHITGILASHLMRKGAQ